MIYFLHFSLNVSLLLQLFSKLASLPSPCTNQFCNIFHSLPSFFPDTVSNSVTSPSFYSISLLPNNLFLLVPLLRCVLPIFCSMLSKRSRWSCLAQMFCRGVIVLRHKRICKQKLHVEPLQARRPRWQQSPVHYTQSSLGLRRRMLLYCSPQGPYVDEVRVHAYHYTFVTDELTFELIGDICSSSMSR